MKPLIIGMGPNRAHPTEAWHRKAQSTTNLCQVITGTTMCWSTVERHFDLIDLNQRWHWIEGLGDSVHPDEAESTLKALIARGLLRGGRKAFLLGEQVTNFVLGWLCGQIAHLPRMPGANCRNAPDVASALSTPTLGCEQRLAISTSSPFPSGIRGFFWIRKSACHPAGNNGR